MSIAENSLKLSGLYEAELLVELMLRFWRHPLGENEEFRNNLLEAAVEILEASTEGTQFLNDLPPASMNLVAAVWYAEWNSLQSDDETDASIWQQRQTWVTIVKQSIPSCFCDPGTLG